MKIFLLVCFLAHITAGTEAQTSPDQGECTPPRPNKDSGPPIRFPFRLKRGRDSHLSGFDLSCDSNNTVEIQFQYPLTASSNNIVLPISVRASVEEIDYRLQTILVSPKSAASCLPETLSSRNASASPYEISPSYTNGFTLFNCSLNSSYDQYSVSCAYTEISCLSRPGYRVYAVSSFCPFYYFPLLYCAKMYNISDFPVEIFTEQPREFGTSSLTHLLHWSQPRCECNNRYCIFRNSTTSEVECLDFPESLQGRRRRIIIGGVFGGIFGVVLVGFVVYQIFRFITRREDEKKIELFLEDYKALRPSRYSYSDIKKITHGFKEKLGKGGFGTVYKGKLSRDVLVAVKLLSNDFKGNGEDFINEVGTIGRIHHVNVVRLVGYCADGFRRALVYEFLPNDSLEKLLSSSNQNRVLGWDKLHQIAIGIAKGIDYLHQGCNQRILHFDIKPHNILLDENFNPKVADFGLAKLCSKDESAVSMTAARGTIGYIAPEVFSRNFGNVSYKSDVYSFGMLLLDMVGGRESTPSSSEDSSEAIFPEWIYSKLEKREELMNEVDKEEDNRIISRLAIVGLWCSQWCPSSRPSMKLVIQMLEGQEIPNIPPNPFASTGFNPKVKGQGRSFSSLLDSISETIEITSVD